MVEYELFKIWPDHLKEMRLPGRKIIDIRVPDLEDKKKDFSKLQPSDTLFFKDTNNEILKTKVMKNNSKGAYVKHYHSAEELVINEGLENVWPNAKSFEEAVNKCLQFPGYKDRVKQNGIYAIGLEKLQIYVAGPYTAPTPEEKKENIMRAIKIGIELSKLGYVPFVPHAATADWELLGLNEQECLAIQRDMIRKSDAFFFIAPSPGTNSERKLALELGMDIFTSVKDVQFWNAANK
jgi:ASC-1-like (ASCH) protein